MAVLFQVTVFLERCAAAWPGSVSTGWLRRPEEVLIIFHCSLSKRIQPAMNGFMNLYTGLPFKIPLRPANQSSVYTLFSSSLWVPQVQGEAGDCGLCVGRRISIPLLRVALPNFPGEAREGDTYLAPIWKLSSSRSVGAVSWVLSNKERPVALGATKALNEATHNGTTEVYCNGLLHCVPFSCETWFCILSTIFCCLVKIIKIKLNSIIHFEPPPSTHLHPSCYHDMPYVEIRA